MKDLFFLQFWDHCNKYNNNHFCVLKESCFLLTKGTKY
jgi:hypothetical protein